MNRSISDASWNELTQKIDYMAVKSGKVFVKVNPKHTSQKCNVCGHVDASSRDKEKYICIACGHMAHADINAAKNIKELGKLNIASIVLGDSKELESRSRSVSKRGSKRPKNRQEISARPLGKRAEPGNPSNRDIKTAMS